ncbi:MAG: hypothetical protein JWN86_1048 [Planctomycetota bacterium]|nr:hypothetical protein [Planctomycetota bacterium]
MRPTIDQIRTAAYGRWERRGRVHGFDRADWNAAEKQQILFVNYRVLTADRLDSEAPRAIGDPSRRRCRFCRQATPRAEFSSRVRIIPDYLGPGSPVAFDQCQECASHFSETVDPGLAQFVRPFLVGSSSTLPGAAGIAVDAYKGLVRLALSVMPVSDLEDHEDTVEWVSNPDHDFDLNVFRDLTCTVHVVPAAFPASWVALAKLKDDREAWPSMLFFLGTSHVVFQILVPLGQRDSDHDGVPITVPDILPPSPFGPEHEPIARVMLPIVSTEAVREPTLR